MRLVDYQRYAKGHFEREENEWERTRLIVSLIYNTNAKKGSQKKLEEILPLNKDKKYQNLRLEKGREAQRQFYKLKEKEAEMKKNKK